jgi:hypothetical protein
VEVVQRNDGAQFIHGVSGAPDGGRSALSRSSGWDRCSPSWRTARPSRGTAGGTPRQDRTAAPAGPR